MIKLYKIGAFALLLNVCATIQAQNNTVLNDDDKAKVAAMAAAKIAQGDTIWKFRGLLGLNGTQTYFSNWAAGGQNNVAVTLLGVFGADYAKGRNTWGTTLDLAYGQLSQGNRSPIKTDDRIDLTSKYGYQLKNPKWFATLLFNFRSQFAPGYIIEEGREIGPKISDFLAPAYSIFSLGLDFRPNDNFSLLMSPLTTKITIVNDDRLATDFGLDAGDNVRFELGAFVKASYQRDIFENVNLLTRIDLFSNYLENPQNIDVNWETLIAMKVNNWLSVTIATQLLYDDDIVIGFVDPLIGENGEIITPGITGGPRTQFKEVLSLGLNWKLL